MEEAGPVFLTGATGFIGGRLAAALAGRGRRLRCLVRDPGRAGALAALGVELVVGDVADERAVARGLEGVDVAIHGAAIYDVGVVDEAALERSNVEGTRVLLGAAKQAGTARVVYVSSAGALGPAGEAPAAGGWQGPFPTVYHRTKARAHLLALAAQAEGMPVIVVCPAYVYGPGDRGPVGRLLAELLGGRLPALVRDPAWFSYVYVDDVAEGLVMAAERGRPGAVYVLGGEAAPFDRFVEEAARLAGVAVPRLRLPRGMALAAGGLADVVSRLTGRRFSLSREAVRAVTGGRWVHDSGLAERELDWRPRPLSEGLPPTVAEALKEIS